MFIKKLRIYSYEYMFICTIVLADRSSCSYDIMMKVLHENLLYFNERFLVTFVDCFRDLKLITGKKD